MVANSNAYQVVWLCRMLGELMHEQINLAKIMCDNKSMIALAKIQFSIARVSILRLNIIIFMT